MPPINQSQSPWTLMDLQKMLNGEDPSADMNSLDSTSSVPGASLSSFSPDAQANINTQTSAANTSIPSMIQNLGAAAPIPAKGISSMPNLGGMDRANAAFDPNKSEGFNLQKDEIEKLKKYRDQIPQGAAGIDLSALAALADAWGNEKSNFAGAYKKPETAEEREAKRAAVDKELADLGGKVSAEEIANKKAIQAGETAKLHYGMLKNSQNEQKASDNEEKDASSLMKFYDTERTGGRLSPIGRAQNNVFKAQDIQALIDQYKKDPNKMPLTGAASLSEIAIGLNSLLSATGGSEESRKSLIPDSARGRFSTIEQFLLNRPVGAEMEEFIKNASDTLSRQVAVNQNQVDAYKKRINAATGGGRLAKSNPQRYKAISDAYLNSPEPATQAAPAMGSGDNEVRRQTSDGKVGIFDKNTKQFLRYE